MTSEAKARAMALSALAHWGGVVEPPRLVCRRENVVFEARLRSGQHVALRLHRPGYQSRAAVEAELEWCEALAARGFATPRPVRAMNGRLTAHLERRSVSCVTWLEGAPIGAGDIPLSQDPDTVDAQGRALGRLLAQLHNLTDEGASPARFEREDWNAEALLGERPLWGPFWENPTLTPDETTLLLAAREKARAVLQIVQDYGPIHADVLRENVLSGPEGYALIDFDDCGNGYRLYDLGTALVQAVGDPMLGRLAKALLVGYTSLRPVPAGQLALVPAFVALRSFASAGWVMTRVAPDDPRMRAYAGRAVLMARHLLAGTVPWDWE